MSECEGGLRGDPPDEPQHRESRGAITLVGEVVRLYPRMLEAGRASGRGSIRASGDAAGNRRAKIPEKGSMPRAGRARIAVLPADVIDADHHVGPIESGRGPGDRMRGGRGACHQALAREQRTGVRPRSGGAGCASRR